ncbi:MAG: rod shape-determining protein MreC [Anaerolineae bacterium]|nr:rod shape-determining protein MreC [Anaerolineae bacterium]
MRTGRSSRLSLIIISMVIAFGLLVGSQLGILGPLQGLIATPIGVIAGVFNRIGFAINGNLDQVNDLEVARQRIAELEDRLAQFQSELVELREVASDYDRLSRLLNYEGSRQNEDYLTANVIASDDPNTLLRTIMIDRGSRDGVTRGMAVVTDQGMLGRVLRVAAGASQVLLITDPSSAISARLQTSRTQGSVVGDLSGNLTMTFIPLTAQVNVGDLVMTSGLGGNLPSDMVLGQVTSVQQFESELYQEATIRSLNNFDTLEIVLIVTNFRPVDTSTFDDNNALDAEQ